MLVKLSGTGQRLNSSTSQVHYAPTAGKRTDPCRRKSGDRRDDDLGPPSGWRDRRRTVERRLPDVQEVEMSAEELVEMLGFAKQS